MASKRKFYVKDQLLPVDEDSRNEFKGHRNFSVEEVPDWCWIPGTDRRSRKAISRNINAFFNNGQGGKIYLGIIDEGRVKGIPLNDYQKDHVIVSMKDLMSRYTPQVTDEQYRLDIIPVIQKEDMWKDNRISKSPKIDPDRLKPHLLRTSQYCWCDKLACQSYEEGILSKEYVIEITIYPHTAPALTYQDGYYHINLHPVYQDEEGNCYFRKQASVVRYNLHEVVEFTIHEIQGHFQPILEELKNEFKQLKEKFDAVLKDENHQSLSS